MLVNHGPQQYELLDEWWIEAGMQGFRPQRASFRAQAAKLPVRDVPIAEVEPLLRQLSHGVFNDNPEFGTARERVVNILRAFREDVPLPPIEIVRATPGGNYRFSLSHGAHRFYCALAAGFAAVPATDVTDELAKIEPPEQRRPTTG
jgi:hypothetical protein